MLFAFYKLWYLLFCIIFVINYSSVEGNLEKLLENAETLAKRRDLINNERTNTWESNFTYLTCYLFIISYPQEREKILGKRD